MFYVFLLETEKAFFLQRQLLCMAFYPIMGLSFR